MDLYPGGWGGGAYKWSKKMFRNKLISKGTLFDYKRKFETLTAIGT